VIGAGIMGSAMARSLAAAGLDTRVWDWSTAAAAALNGAGVTAAASALDAGVVITMLPTAAATESVIFDGGVAAAFAEGSVWAQMGTIGVQATLGFRDRLAAARPGVTFVDAPVSGSKGPAEQGQLLILASGPETAAGPLRPVFDAIGRKTVWLGQAGQGSIVKLVVNAYLSILIEGVAETMELADRLGISHQQLADVIEGGPLDAPLAGAKRGREAPPLLAALSGQWHTAVAAGHGRQDVSAARLALSTPDHAS
jgi:3-hydroxyisobutyrate dehydrogenase